MTEPEDPERFEWEVEWWANLRVDLQEAADETAQLLGAERHA